MFGWEIFQRIQEAQGITPRKSVEDLINKDGRGICEYCEEEIFRNDKVPGGGWTWESESLVGFCDKTRTNRHTPRIKYIQEEGV